MSIAKNESTTEMLKPVPTETSSFTPVNNAKAIPSFGNVARTLFADGMFLSIYGYS